MIIRHAKPLYVSPVMTGYSVSYSAGPLALPSQTAEAPWNKKQKIEIGVAAGGAAGLGATLIWHAVHGIAGAHGPTVLAFAKVGEFIFGGVVLGGATGAVVVGMGGKHSITGFGLGLTTERPS